ncbi:MAG TPA: MFS transporter [Steroidobacteraceae bacterium]|jgi:PAT family beta-lactamase induction signal transducer AmpG|nr:MFS transporter [Steroidobacteraceae bacterium]
MLFLGFSSGLPFLLVFSTLSVWLRQAGIERSTIGLFSWVGFAYSFEFVFSPVVDRLELPILHRLLGRRRSWMLLGQIGVALGLLRLAAADPLSGVGSIALAALFVACCSATQDIAMNAWRIESAPAPLQGAMVATYSVGYRVAQIAGGAGALAVAAGAGWHMSYSAMAALMAVGIVTTVLVEEPEATVSRAEQQRETRVVDWLERRAHWPRSLQKAGEWFIGSVLCPLTDFFGRFGAEFAVLCLAFIGLYQITEFTMGSMANPFYIDRGYTLDQIAVVGKFCGFTVGIAGVFLAGALVARLGLMRSLAVGICLAILSNLSYALLATAHAPTLLGLGFTNGLDNLALSVQGVTLIAFLSSLTSPKYTATQYALFASLYALPGKSLEGTSGFVVDRIGYSHFFLYTASLSVPGVLLLAWLWRRIRPSDSHQEP